MKMMKKMVILDNPVRTLLKIFKILIVNVFGEEVKTDI